ncbi:PTS lactose/cellobiose transporter subunit IIA [Lacticaseibacillus nasuensis]|uniref:PTS system lactose-specific EIIA component n=1 Tax=Lacticaseibacillus nasuensis JCM 17158 TaxID=1291734 RepID=A0A0R1JH15_9LACO|nr:PTS lactose/cellobiose transporter subunit IIA [Lacticaseibacillus nasuensis]KRK70392.1 hypothetical protein FD02_GL000457 [Lacticaseibacillus nasuensis JCM 17158]MCX2454488.1 PTS lactose/cellobiose transporter subunit IIA [Lacticaseibacillus nasuensis]
MTREEISFELIAQAGSAFSLLVEALGDARQHEFIAVEEKLAQAETVMNKAHNVQTELITSQMNGEDQSVDVLLAHAQDTLMNTILMFTITKEFIHLYEEEAKQ